MARFMNSSCTCWVEMEACLSWETSDPNPVVRSSHPRPPAMEAPSPPRDVCLSRLRLWMPHWHRRFERERGETGRGRLTGLDVQIRTRGSGRKRRGCICQPREAHLLTLQLGRDGLAHWPPGRDRGVGVSGRRWCGGERVFSPRTEGAL